MESILHSVGPYPIRQKRAVDSTDMNGHGLCYNESLLVDPEIWISFNLHMSQNNILP